MNSPVYSSKTWAGSGWGIALAALCGCTALDDGSDTAKVPKWSCLESPPEPLTIPSDRPNYIAYVVPIFDFTQQRPTKIPGLNTSLCQLNDTACPPPAPPTGPQFDANLTFAGVDVTVPMYTFITAYGINAYIRLEAPGYLPMEYYLGGPLAGIPPSQAMSGLDLSMLAAALPEPGKTPIVVGLPIAPIAERDADDLATKIRKVRDPFAAIIAVRTLDCFDEYAAGVKVRLSPESGVPFTYLTGQVRFDEDTGTDRRGLAGFANVEIPIELRDRPTNVIVTGIAPNGQEYGAINVTIRAGAVTLASIRHTVDLYGL